jgi:hypothetical protein
MDTKRMSSFAFIMLLFPAAVFDLVSIIPFLGNLTSVLFIFFARLSFWLVGYRSKGTAALTMGTALVEMIPGFSILPGCIGFVTGFYLINKASAVLSETKVGRLAVRTAEAEGARRQKNAEKTNEGIFVA